MIRQRTLNGRPKPHHTPLEDPEWLPAADDGHMRPDDTVIGMIVDDRARAIPWWVMKNHHVANLVLDGLPIMVVLCEACCTAGVFRPMVDGRPHRFRVEGKYRGTHILRDDETGSLWAPMNGIALHGPLRGARLERLPVYWDAWVRFGGLSRLQALTTSATWRGAPSGPAQGGARPAGQEAGGLLKLFRDRRWAMRDALLRRRFERGLEDVARRFRPDLIHAHSPYLCGLPALRVARRHGLPFVYEARGVWEESTVAREGEASRGSRAYRWWHQAESTVMIRADAVVCIGERLREEVVARGVAPARVVVVPNAVDPSIFRPSTAATVEVAERVRDVRRRLRGLTLGYAGSLRKLEGVDELIRATAELVRRGRDVSLLVIGHSEDHVDGLKALARDLGLGERAVFTGRVPHDQIAAYYDLIDVFVISRPALRVTQLVTPLKPLEAMAMAKPLVVSDLAALHELVIDGRTGVFYTPGDIGGLADVCARLLDDAQLRRELGERARHWVIQNRTWPIVLRQLYPVYESLVDRAASKIAASAESGRP